MPLTLLRETVAAATKDKVVMMRKSGTSLEGYSFDQASIRAVWNKGRPVAGYDPAVYRQDCCGAWMRYTDHGNTNSEFGWEIDHVVPVARGGGDQLSNLQPLQWRNNRSKSDNFPNWSCAV